jgi:hypothetical protein
MYVAAKGGSLDRKANAAMLGYLANAYAQRGNNEGAITALKACYGFQRTRGIADAIKAFEDVGVVGEQAPAHLDGQMYAMAALVIPVILLAGAYTALHLYYVHAAPVYHAHINHLMRDAHRFFVHMRVAS